MAPGVGPPEVRGTEKLQRTLAAADPGSQRGQKVRPAEPTGPRKSPERELGLQQVP